MNVLIAGENPFVEEVAALCQQAGYKVKAFLVEDFYDAIESGYVLEDLPHIQVAIELHNESAEAKQELLMAFGRALPSSALVLSSVLPISTTQAGAWVSHPEQLVGIGLVPPLKAAGMVELAAGLKTSPQALAQAQQFWQAVGLEPVVVQDGPGLVRARTICCLINEAVMVLMEGVATAADIDKAMQLGTNYPHGLLAWADYMGLDAVLGVMQGLHEEWGEARYRPSPLLKRMVLAGKLGQKSGEGFFTYQK